MSHPRRDVPGERLSSGTEQAIRRALARQSQPSLSIRVLLAEVDALRAELAEARQLLEYALEPLHVAEIDTLGWEEQAEAWIRRQEQEARDEQ